MLRSVAFCVNLGIGVLQRKIFRFIFGKVQSLWFWGNALTGIIPEFPAFVRRGAHTFFRTKDQILLQANAVKTIGTGAFDLFSKKHGNSSETKNESFPVLYTSLRGKATPILCFSQNKRQDHDPGQENQHLIIP